MNDSDLVGLDSNHRKQIQDGGLYYSVKCGWIDLGHLRMVKKISSVIYKEIIERRNVTRWNEGKTQFLLKFRFRDWNFTNWNDIIKNNFNQMQGHYYVMRNDARRDPWAVVHGIVKDMSVEMERRQVIGEWAGANGSGFSAEDLLSNYLGYVSAKYNYSINDINFFCGAVQDRKINECLYDEIGGLDDKRNHEWMCPLDFNAELQNVYMKEGIIEYVNPMDFPFYDYLIEAFRRTHVW